MSDQGQVVAGQQRGSQCVYCGTRIAKVRAEAGASTCRVCEDLLGNDTSRPEFWVRVREARRSR